MDQRTFPAMFESLELALDEDIRALGGRKAVAMKLRPDLAHKPHDAHVWLNSCLNPGRAHRLSDAQIRMIMRLARDVGSQAAMDYWCLDAGFEPAKPVSAKEEADKILERAGELAAAMRGMTTQLERLNASGALKTFPKAATG